MLYRRHCNVDRQLPCYRSRSQSRRNDTTAYPLHPGRVKNRKIFSVAMLQCYITGDKLWISRQLAYTCCLYQNIFHGNIFVSTLHFPRTVKILSFIVLSRVKSALHCSKRRHRLLIICMCLSRLIFIAEVVNNIFVIKNVNIS